MSVFERKRLLAGLLKIELEIAAVTNGCLIIYSPDVDAYLAIPQSVFGIETDLEAQMLMESSLVSPDVVLPAGVDSVNELFADGLLLFATTTQAGAYGVNELFADGLALFATTTRAGEVLKIHYAIRDGCAIPVSGNRLKRLEGIVTSILDIGLTVGKRRAKARRGKVVTEITHNASMHTERYAVGENYITMACNAALTNKIQYTVTENEAGGLTYDITTDAYEETDGAYIIGGSDGG